MMDMIYHKNNFFWKALIYQNWSSFGQADDEEIQDEPLQIR